MIRLLASYQVKIAGPLSSVVLAQETTRYFDEAGIGAAILLTVTGMILHWHLPWPRMSTDEQMKDGKLTVEEARRQIRFYSWCAPIATVAGILVLEAVLLDLMR